MKSAGEAGKELAALAIKKMRDGDLLAIGPDRSEAILAVMFEHVIARSIEQIAAEREGCARTADVRGAPEIAAAIRARGAS